MAFTPDPEFEALQDKLDEAWTAEIPSLVEIRRRREHVVEYLASCVMELMDADVEEANKPIPLRVISSKHPCPGMPRGICSPLKTREMVQFEAQLREAFGDIESCTTAWPD